MMFTHFVPCQYAFMLAAVCICTSMLVCVLVCLSVATQTED